jgi:Flp pilus assembly pilin Flp
MIPEIGHFALILALVVVVAIAALQGLGGDITSILDQVRAAL